MRTVKNNENIKMEMNSFYELTNRTNNKNPNDTKTMHYYELVFINLYHMVYHKFGRLNLFYNFNQEFIMQLKISFFS